MNWKGWGYEELSDAWNIKGEYNELPEKISKYMLESMSLDEDDELQKKTAKDLREFLLKLADNEEKIGYTAPLWRGLAAIEDDQTLLKYASELVEHMWS